MSEFWRKITTADIRNVIAIMYTLLVLIVIYVLIFKPVPLDNKDLVNVLGGTIISGEGVILSFYFGASKKEKDGDDK